MTDKKETKLTEEDILLIPDMAEQGMSINEMVEFFKKEKKKSVHYNTIRYWIAQLRKRGIKVKMKKGGRPSRLQTI